jgi:hypothetical protein
LTPHTKRTRQWTDPEIISKKWAKELESDELNVQKKISVKIETHKALRGIAKTNESYDGTNMTMTTTATNQTVGQS